MNSIVNNQIASNEAVLNTSWSCSNPYQISTCSDKMEPLKYHLNTHICQTG